MRDHKTVRPENKTKPTANNLTNYLNNYNHPLTRTETEGGPFNCKADGWIEVDKDDVRSLYGGIIGYQEIWTKW